jgi:hypothetical protein
MNKEYRDILKLELHRCKQARRKGRKGDQILDYGFHNTEYLPYRESKAIYLSDSELRKKLKLP